MKYEWSRRMAPVEADVVGEELERIRSLTGQLRPRTVVDEARPEGSPIHAAFEWDDSAAGEKYRVHQARNLIRAVRVVHEDDASVDDTGVSESHPQFVHIDDGKDPYYQDASVAVQNVDEFALAVSGLAKKVAGAQHALSELQSMAGEHGADTTALLGIVAAALATAHDAIARVN